MSRLVWFLVAVPLLADGTVPGRYIIELSEPPAAEQLARTAARQGRAAQASGMRPQIARVRAQQRQVGAQAEARGAEVLDSVSILANALMVRIPDSRAAALAQIPGVIRVWPERLFRPMLDHAVQLHHVTDVWNTVGYDNAGLGTKIAIIDTGIDITHPAFQDPSLPVPDGYPKTDAAGKDYTNNKVIVARCYAALFPNPDPDASPADHVGHGTATAMAAAGARNAGPLATIAGVAPKAYVGVYKVFGSAGVNDKFASDSAIIKAIEDAVSDGMDVINLSIGANVAPDLANDLEAQALERASAAGVVVVVSAGNNGSDPFTISSPATAPSVIAAGASFNERIFAGKAALAGGTSYLAIPADETRPDAPITAAVVDVATLDESGMACSPLPSGSLNGQIALILRGVCTFEVKLNNAQAAGAVGALVYTDQARPDPGIMGIGGATLPAGMVSYSDGLDIKQQLTSGLQMTLDFSQFPWPSNADRIAAFSARGPNVDWGIKPELVAVGTDFYTATEAQDSKGEMYSAGGYTETQGTSFSSPLIAGAAALLKAARPGLTAAQYRSLLVNSADAISVSAGQPAAVQQAGVGRLNAAAALASDAAFAPVSLSFGTGGGDIDAVRTLTIGNVGSTAETYHLAVLPRGSGAAPSLAVDTVQLDPGTSRDIPVQFSGTGLAPGEYQGFIAVSADGTGLQSRIPYWYGVASIDPRHITLLSSPATPPHAGATVTLELRITDASGIYVAGLQPAVTVVSGGAQKPTVRADRTSPGAFSVQVHLGATAGPNVLRVQAGDLTSDFTITTAN